MDRESLRDLQERMKIKDTGILSKKLGYIKGIVEEAEGKKIQLTEWL